MPAEIRNKIYRLVLVKNHFVTTSSTSRSPLPGVVSVCKQLRNETFALCYAENKFSFSINGYDVQPLIPWCRLVKQLGVEEHIRATNHFDIYWKPTWSELLNWCKAIHGGDFRGVGVSILPQPVVPTGHTDPVGLTTVAAMQQAAELMASKPSEEVEPVLRTYRAILLVCGHVTNR